MSSVIANNNNTNRYSRIIKYVGTLFLIVAISGALFNRMQASPVNATDVDDFLARVQAKGGMLVRCENNECRDIKTNDYVGQGPDGMIITYPQGAVSDEELKQESDTLKGLMDKQKQQESEK